MNLKNLEDIAIIVQARLNSQRVPQKMIRNFCGTNLFEILLQKLDSSKLINNSNVYCSVHEGELKNVVRNYSFNIYNRSYESANEDNDIRKIYEWHKDLKQKYVVLISACNPLLKLETIENFILDFMKTEKEGSFAVFEKKTYYWDTSGKPITDWKGSKIMNTKTVEPIYEASHCLYASKISFLENEFWMDDKTPPQPNLFVMEELEAFDIDYEWQFLIGEQLWEKMK